jgi:hypothetical protein
MFEAGSLVFQGEFLERGGGLAGVLGLLSLLLSTVDIVELFVSLQEAIFPQYLKQSEFYIFIYV